MMRRCTIFAAVSLIIVGVGCTEPVESPGTNVGEDGGMDLGTDVGMDGGEEDMTPPGPPELSTGEDEFTFKGVGQGNSEEVSLEVQNVGGSEVFITDVNINDDVGPAFDELQLASDAPEFPVVLEPGTFESFPLVYTPADAAADRGDIVVEPASANVEPLRVPFQSVTAAPDLRAPNILRIGDVPVGESKTKVFDVINRGQQTLTIQNIDVPSSSELTVSYPTGSDPFPVSVQQDESFTVEVTFTPEDDSTEQLQLSIESNDPDDSPFPVTVTANQPDPCLEVSTLSIDFGELVRVRETTPLTLLNCSNDRVLTIRSAAFSTDGQGAFSVEPTGDGQLSFPTDIASGQTLELSVVAEMSEPREARGTLVIRSNDEARNPLLISVSAVYPE